jgi:hypothetical protein
VVQYCIFEANNTGDGNFKGGAALLSQCDARFINCTFIDNEGEYGGAIRIESSSPDFEFCRFIRNRARRNGGGISFGAPEGYHLTLTNCTFARNSCFPDPTYASGIMCISPGHTTIENSIIAFGLSGWGVGCLAGPTVDILCSDVYGNNFGNGDWEGGCIEDQAPPLNDNICEDPLFCDLLNGDVRLQLDSPCTPYSPPNPDCALIGGGTVGCGTQGILGVRALIQASPTLSCSPNPFLGGASITYAVCPSEAAKGLRLAVYDSAGRLIRTLERSCRRREGGNVFWDGAAASGQPVGPGVYFLVLNTGADRTWRRVVLIR